MFKVKSLMILFLATYGLGLVANFRTIAIPVEQFCKGNSLVIFTRDESGNESTACIDLEDQQLKYSQEEVSMLDADAVSFDEREAVVAHIDGQSSVLDSSDTVCVYFDVDANVDVVRALIVKNSFLADSPFDVVELSTNSLFEDDDPFGDDDEFASMNFDNVEDAAPVKLAWYDSLAIYTRLLWAVQAKSMHRKFDSAKQWVYSKFRG